MKSYEIRIGSSARAMKAKWYYSPAWPRGESEAIKECSLLSTRLTRRKRTQSDFPRAGAQATATMIRAREREPRARGHDLGAHDLCAHERAHLLKYYFNFRLLDPRAAGRTPIHQSPPVHVPIIFLPAHKEQRHQLGRACHACPPPHPTPRLNLRSAMMGRLPRPVTLESSARVAAPRVAAPRVAAPRVAPFGPL